MLITNDPNQIEDVLFKYHLELAKFIIEKIHPFNGKKIVEIGAGLGTFTLPLLMELGNDFEKLYCIDSYNGPYLKHKETLESNLKSYRFGQKVEIIEMDVREMDKVLSEIDLIIGHEILCDLNSKQVEELMVVCYKILKPNGIFVHSEFSPYPLNKSEELIQIINNEYSMEPISDTKWFSPTADELAGISHKVGFQSIRAEYKKIPIKFTGNAAVKIINGWQTKQEFFEKYQDKIDANGIEYPMEQIICCIK
jgi:SAM-dependent methyltransferase